MYKLQQDSDDNAGLIIDKNEKLSYNEPKLFKDPLDAMTFLMDWCRGVNFETKDFQIVEAGDKCKNCNRFFTDDVCNRRLECYRGKDDMCSECNDYFKRREANPNRDQNVHVRMKARILGPYRHHKTKEVIGYIVSIYLGKNRKPINTVVRLDQIEELELLQ